ncbi:MAG TPA: phosphatase PAP2 family protein, partial [Acidimicrobiales bacterium]|nr:phosphatase PAP2 family protein [Acidimicrobiales bacterium]
VALLIGLARLTLSVHWFTDVLGGWALGTLWFAVVVVVSQVASSLHHRDLRTGPPPPPPPAEPVAQETLS